MSFFSLFPTVTSSCFSISFFFLFYFFFFFLSFFLSFFISFFLSLPFRRDYDEFPTLRQNVFVSPLHPFARLWEHLRRRGRGHVRLFPPKVRNGEKQLHHEAEQNSIALWSGINKNQDVSTGPLARPFARSLAPLTRSLARSLRSLPRSWGSEFLMSQNDLGMSHSASAAGAGVHKMRLLRLRERRIGIERGEKREPRADDVKGGCPRRLLLHDGGVEAGRRWYSSKRRVTGQEVGNFSCICPQ